MFIFLVLFHHACNRVVILLAQQFGNPIVRIYCMRRIISLIFQFLFQKPTLSNAKNAVIWVFLD